MEALNQLALFKILIKYKHCGSYGFQIFITLCNNKFLVNNWNKMFICFPFY